MKKLIILIFAFAFASPSLFAQTKAGKIDTVKHLTIYTCPMHNEVAASQPGNCPKCGMALALTKKEGMKTDLKNYTCPMHLEVVKHDPGKCPKCGKKLSLSTKEQMKTEVVKMYTCPMHPEIALDKDGKCPKCGDALLERK